MRLRLASGVAAFAARRNTPESTPHTIISAASNFRSNENGRDQRIQAATPPVRKTAKTTPKIVIAHF
jgi:hypothetical protein